MDQDFIGVYEHYKGNKYQVVGVGVHTETGEKMVIYHALNDPDTIWIRPFNMFFEAIKIEGNKILRFRKISPLNLQ